MKNRSLDINSITTYKLNNYVNLNLSYLKLVVLKFEYIFLKKKGKNQIYIIGKRYLLVIKEKTSIESIIFILEKSISLKRFLLISSIYITGKRSIIETI